MTISHSLSTRVRPDGKAEVLLRVSISRAKVFRVKSGIYIFPSCFKGGEISIPRSLSSDRTEMIEARNALISLGEHLVTELDKAEFSEDVSTKWLQSAVQRFHIPDKKEEHTSVIKMIDYYLDDNKLAKNTHRNLRNLARTIERFEVIRGDKWAIETITTDELREFRKFLSSEPSYKADARWRDLYIGVHTTERGQNTISKMLSQFRTIVKWAYKMGYTTEQPFLRFKVEQEKYGTPYFLTLEERDRIAALRLEDEKLATYRDIFILQCYIGCRVSDLFRLGPTNVVEGRLEYVPLKTSRETMQLVRIPLHPVAAEIVMRYYNKGRATLFSRTLMPYYNKAIKNLLFEAGITRAVSIINPRTQQEERVRICDVGASHLARRTFSGNLYKQIKDPDLIGSLTGHAPGSRAFKRYRAIDDEVKQQTIELLG